MLRERAPQLEADGEMQADTALSLLARQRVITDCRLDSGVEANVLIFPNLDADLTPLLPQLAASCRTRYRWDRC